MRLLFAGLLFFTTMAANACEYWRLGFSNLGSNFVQSYSAESTIGAFTVELSRAVIQYQQRCFNEEGEEYLGELFGSPHEAYARVKLIPPSGQALELASIWDTKVGANDEELDSESRRGREIHVTEFFGSRYVAPGLVSVTLRVEESQLGLRIEEKHSPIFNPDPVRFVPLEGVDAVLEVARALSLQGALSTSDYTKMLELFPVR
jgi:hypothetical protein